MHSWLNKIQALVDILSAEDYGDFGFIAEVLLRDMWRQLGEINNLIENHIGDIKFDIVAHGDVVYREGRLLSVSVEKEQNNPEQKKSPCKG